MKGILMLKYRTTHWEALRIDEVEVERESSVSVWIDGQCVRKQSNWALYFDTWEEAHAFLVAKAQRKVNRCQDQLKEANEKLRRAQALCK
jgi:hypothetical protein